MANPQPDKFTKLSNELYEAIMQTDFSKRQRNILDLVIRMSYGFGKKSALLRPSDFELVGVRKGHVKQELNYLVQSKVLIINGDQIQLNKNYDQWRVSLVTCYDPEKFKEVIKRNLANNPVTKTVTSVTEMVTNGETELPNQELDSYQNSNSAVTKTVTDTASNPSNDKGFERSKETLKKSKDINDDDDIYSPELEETSSEPDERINKIKNHFSKKAQKIWYSHEEDMAMIRLLDEGVPVKTILDGIDLAFERFKPKHSRDRINSFRYCLSAIYELHERGVDHATSKSSSQIGNRKNSGYPEISQGYYDQFDIFA